MTRRRGRKPAIRRTEGRRQLLKILATKSQVEVARALGVEQPAISVWARGNSRPEPHFRDALERLYGIPRDAWYSAGELAIAHGSRTDTAAE